MTRHALTFSSLLKRLKTIGADVVVSPPAPVGSVWLFGKKPGVMPWTRGPIYPIKARGDNELVPRKVVEKILKHLGLKDNDVAQFWNIEEHDRPSA